MEIPEEAAQEAAEARRSALEAELETALAEHFPGLEIVDRDLELAGSRRHADLVATDRAGRHALILLVDGAVPETALAALEALAFVRANAGLLARHLGAPRARARREPAPAPRPGVLVVLVAESFSSALLETLAVLAAEDLQLFAVRELRTAGGRRSYLTPVPLAARARAHAPTLAEFLAALAPDVRTAAESAVLRIERIDPGLAREVGEAAIRWHLDEHELCALVRVRDARREAERAGGDRVEGLLAATGERTPIEPAAELESFLHRVVREYLRLAAEEPESEHEERVHPRMPAAPLLSPEEIAAFHD